MRQTVISPMTTSQLVGENSQRVVLMVAAPAGGSVGIVQFGSNGSSGSVFLFGQANPDTVTLPNLHDLVRYSISRDNPTIFFEILNTIEIVASDDCWPPHNYCDCPLYSRQVNFLLGATEFKRLMFPRNPNRVFLCLSAMFAAGIPSAWQPTEPSNVTDRVGQEWHTDSHFVLRRCDVGDIICEPCWLYGSGLVRYVGIETYY